MPNILLTQKCVRSCPYCFAKKHMSSSPPEDVLSWENLIYIADFLENSGEKAVSLLGGEPFLHPEFVNFALYLLERNFHVNVFTSGIMSDKVFFEANNVLSSVDPSRLSFVCNLNEPKNTPFSESEVINRFLSAFGHLTSAGFNIYKTDFNLDFLFQLISKFGLQKHLRLGLAHPIPGKKNKYIEPSNLGIMAKNLIDYVPQFERLKITPGFDCGLPLCIFSDDEIGKLFKVCKGNLNFGCGPAIDIGPDMMVWSCFPLSNYNKKSLFEFDSFMDIFSYFNKIHHTIRVESSGLYQKCDNCKYREDGLCSGGCLAHSLNNFIGEAKIRYHEVYEDV